MNFALANMLQIALIAVGLMGVFLTLDRPRLRAATALMGMVALWMAFNLAEEVFNTRSIWLVTPAFRLLYPPLLYLLVRSLIYSGPGLKRQDWPHGLPFLITLAMTPYVELVEHAARLSLVIYGGAALYLLHRFHRLSKNRRSDAASIRLRALYVVIAIFAADTVFDVVRMDARWLHDDWPWLASAAAYQLQLIISLAMTAVLVFIAVRRESAFEGLAADALAPGEPVIAAPEDRLEAEFSRLDQLVRKEELFPEPRLTRAELAQACQLPERQVSQVIRTATGRNFNDYINALRIEDVQAMMREDAERGERRRILDLAYTAGFSSKSVFNEVFKRETGVTPSAFANSLDKPG